MDAITLVVGACGVLAGVVGYLYKVTRTQDDRHASVVERVGRLEGEKDGIIRMSKQTLEVVHRALSGESRAEDVDELYDEVAKKQSKPTE